MTQGIGEDKNGKCETCDRPFLENEHAIDGKCSECAEPCECVDKAPPGEYYHCRICDAEWLPEDEE